MKVQNILYMNLEGDPPYSQNPSQFQVDHYISRVLETLRDMRGRDAQRVAEQSHTTAVTEIGTRKEPKRRQLQLHKIS